MAGLRREEVAGERDRTSLPIVPGNEDHRVLPIGERLAVDQVGAWTVANSVDDRRDPGGSGAVGICGMVGFEAGGMTQST